MIDVRALRTLFGTPISKGRVAPRTAQAAARHSKIDPATNAYTNPKLLDVYGALDSRPSLNLDASPSTERNTMRATGTDHQDRIPTRDRISSSIVPNTGKRGAVSLLSTYRMLAMNERREERLAKTA